MVVAVPLLIVAVFTNPSSSNLTVPEALSFAMTRISSPYAVSPTVSSISAFWVLM